MSNNYDKIETDNALLDEVVYNLKILISSCLLFNEHDALELDTKESIYNSDRYIAIKNGSIKFYMFNDYEEIDFLNTGLRNNNLIAHYMDDYDSIPDNYKEILLKSRCERFLNNYEEINNYYRNIMGLPPFGESGIYLDDEMKDKLVGYNISINKPIHLMSSDDITILKSTGVMDELISNYPDDYYLKNVGKNIDYIKLRTSKNYGLLYINDQDAESTIASRFKSALEKNRIYVIKTLSDDSYRLYNDYYDRFMIMIIIIQSACDVINQMPELYINKEIFDIRTCQYFLESNGIPFFPEIPLKYQIKLVKNINKLCNNKGTNENIMDICAIFGFENIKIYKYYLNKFRKKNNNNPLGFVSDSENSEDIYDLRFIKVPLNEEVDNYIKSSANYVDYSILTNSDPYWSGPYNSRDIKKSILDQDFNTIKSKYISMDSVYSLTELTFQICYFMNMLLYSNIDLNNLYVSVPFLNGNSRFVDLFAYLYSLMYWYIGVDDDIVQDMSLALEIKGFNFEADLNEISEYIINKKLDPKDFGYQNFDIPDGSIVSINRLKQLFINNKNIYDFVTKNMYKSQTKEQYDCFKKIYDSLFITNINNKIFYIESEDRYATTYTEFLKYRDQILYEDLIKCQSLFVPNSDNEVMNKEINNRISSTMTLLNGLLDSEDLKYLFNNMPSDKADVVMEYITKIVNFFKSYTTALSTLQNVYLTDLEHVFVIDQIANIVRTFSRIDNVFIKDLISSIYSNINKTSKISIHDMINIIRSRIEYIKFNKEDSDMVKVYDIILAILVNYDANDNITIEDYFDIFRKYNRKYEDINIIKDTINNINSTLNNKTYVNIYDMMYITSIVYALFKYEDKIIIKDRLETLNVTINKINSVLNIKDMHEKNTVLWRSCYNINKDEINSIKSFLSNNINVDIRDSIDISIYNILSNIIKDIYVTRDALEMFIYNDSSKTIFNIKDSYIKNSTLTQPIYIKTKDSFRSINSVFNSNSKVNIKDNINIISYI